MRFHKPEKFGDDLSSFRATVVKVNESKKEVSGLEVGVADVGEMVVSPVFDESGNHIGSVEYGGNLDSKFIEKYVNQQTEEVKKNGLNVSIITKNLKGEFMLTGSNYEKELQKDSEKISRELGKKDYIIKIKKESAKAKLQRDIYETAILLPQEIGLEEDLDLLTKAAREMYELQFPGERLPE